MEKGIKTNTDFFNFEHVLYKESNHEWRELTENDIFEMYPLNIIEVHVNIKHSGAYKNKQIKILRNTE